MKKFVDGYEKKLKAPRYQGTDDTPVEPFREAQKNLIQAQFVDQVRQEFFNAAYLDILVELFGKWLTSEPHCTKEREFYYHSAMALGAVNEMMVRYETAGKNVSYMRAQEALAKKEQNK